MTDSLSTPNRLERVYTGRNPTEAHLVKGLLETAGVQAEIRGEALFGARGEIPMDEAMPSVWVLEADAGRARDVLKDFYSDESDAVRPAQWICAQCGETLDGQFTACWNCGTERAIDDRAT